MMHNTYFWSRSTFRKYSSQFWVSQEKQYESIDE